MQNILILGGTGDALSFAEYCHNVCKIHTKQNQLNVIYSIAGVARTPKVDFDIRVGGFGDWQGLSRFISAHSISLLIDVTHPYATKIKSNALMASHEAAITLLRFIRPVWQESTQDNWTHVADLEEVAQRISNFKRPFFSIGRSAFQLLTSKQQSQLVQQHWTIRYIQTNINHYPDICDDVSLINGIGPFSVDEEVRLFEKHNIDVLISKNSGGDGVFAKIVAARQLGIPVLMLKRPLLPKIPKHFDYIADLEAELATYIKNV